MATVDMDDIYPDNSEHQCKNAQQSPPEIIVIDDKDVTIEEEHKDNAIIKVVKKNPKIYGALKYGVERIIIPACLSTLHKFLYSMVDFLIYESPRGIGWGERSGPVDYNRRYRNDDPFADKYDSSSDDMYIYERPYRTSRNEQFGLHKIGFATKESARRCLNEMQHEIDIRGRVSLDYYFRYIGKTPPTRMCGQWGWVSLNEVTITPAPKGFRINFPEVINIQ